MKLKRGVVSVVCDPFGGIYTVQFLNDNVVMLVMELGVRKGNIFPMILITFRETKYVEEYFTYVGVL